jgi:lysophospholipase L1-like esterase
MLRWTFVLVCAAVAAGCGGSPTGPTGDRARMATLSRTSFLAFGDSMTAGEVTSPAGSGILTSTKQVLVPAAAYPSILHGHLTIRYAAQSSSIVVTNAGKPSEHPHEGVQRFIDTFAATRPEAVLLLDGANSLWLYGTDLPTLALGRMVDVAQAAGARVFVATQPPTRPGRSHSQPMVELLSFNRKLAEMAAVKGAALVNLYDPMLPEAETLIGSDGLHPTEAGYRRIAEVFFNAIRAELETR